MVDTSELDSRASGIEPATGAWDSLLGDVQHLPEVMIMIAREVHLPTLSQDDP